MKCPFVERECVGRDCVGWSNGMCFVEVQTNKLETLTALIAQLSLDIKEKLPSQEDKSKNVTPAVEELKPAVQVISPVKKDRIWETIQCPPAAGDVTLSIDFGTAFSKMAFKLRSDDISTPLPLNQVAINTLYDMKLIGEASDAGRNFMEDSVLYVDDDERVYCGTLASNKYFQASSAGNTRPAIRNFKQRLIGKGAELPIPHVYFPGSSTLSMQDIMAIYLAYLLRLARNFADSVKDKDVLDIDSSLKNFSMPVWSDGQYRDSVKTIFKGAIAKAYCLEKWLGNQLISGVPISQALDALKEAERYADELQTLIVGKDITEPVAAGYRRIVELNVESGRPHHIFVIDVGAGSTDYAFYSISRPLTGSGKKIHVSNIQWGINKGVAVWDFALRTLLHKKVMDISGADNNNHEFQIFSAKLDSQLSRLKEDLLASEGLYSVDASPILSSPVTISRDELEQSVPVVETISMIKDGLDKFMSDLSNEFAYDHFDPGRTEFLVTGGGSFIKSIVDRIEDCAACIGPPFRKRVISSYIPPDYIEIPNISKFYPMLAVSLGSTERDYPAEGVLPPVEKFKKGSAILERYPTKGA